MKQSGGPSGAEGDAETVTVCQRDVYEMQNVWETFDVTSAVRYWLANPDEPQVLQVSLRRATGRESPSGLPPEGSRGLPLAPRVWFRIFVCFDLVCVSIFCLSCWFFFHGNQECLAFNCIGLYKVVLLSNFFLSLLR